MKKIVLFLFVTTMFIACGQEDDAQEIYTLTDTTPKASELYYWDDSGNKVPLVVDSSMWHVLISQKSYNRIEEARTINGEKSLAYVAYVDSAYFKRYGPVVDDRVFGCVGYVETFVRRDELFLTDECLYIGVVYSSGEIPSYRQPKYNATSMRISVVLPNHYTLTQVQELLQPYSVCVYTHREYYEDTTLYELFYINGKGGESAQAVVNALHENEEFVEVFQYSVIFRMYQI